METLYHIKIVTKSIKVVTGFRLVEFNLEWNILDLIPIPFSTRYFMKVNIHH